MKLLCDANVDESIARACESLGWEVVRCDEIDLERMAEGLRSLRDREVLELAHRLDAVAVSFDGHLVSLATFGVEQVGRESIRPPAPHAGVVHLRLKGFQPRPWLPDLVAEALTDHAEDLADAVHVMIPAGYGAVRLRAVDIASARATAHLQLRRRDE